MDNDLNFRPTVEWMRLKYNELNKEYFNNSLGGCDFSIFKTGRGASGNVLGYFKLFSRGLSYDCYDRRILLNKNGVYLEITKNNFEIAGPMISLNGNYRGSEESFIYILIHEMCHYYTYMNGIVPTQAHGPEFRKIGRFVSLRSNGLYSVERIASSEVMSNLQLSDEMVNKNNHRKDNKINRMKALFLFYSSGKKSLVTTSSDELINFYLRYKKDPYLDKIILSTDINLIKFLYDLGYSTNLRSRRYYDISNVDWLEKLDGMNYEVLYSKLDEAIIKATSKVINEVLGKRVNNNLVKLDSEMNLGLYSPIEL